MAGSAMAADKSGTLYVVATPIGNLDDFSPRAVEVLKRVALIAAEDTRTSHTLLARFGIATKLVAVHDHNEREAGVRLVERLRDGHDVALISDAGTPLISDPGFRFVRLARDAGVEVRAIPGPCAAIAALSIAGLPTDRFVFEGFLPPKSAARIEALRALAADPRTQVFYEAKHRIVEMLRDVVETHGATREVVVARELTKLHETVHAGPVSEVVERVAGEREQQLGEFVVMVAGVPELDRKDALLREGERVMRIIAAEMPGSRAARLAAEITGAPKNALYKLLEAAPDETG
jgi:16S rRNA (cytidine1402-2'-O)-methyltransferase